MLAAMAEGVLPTGTVTFLFSDMEGSTRLALEGEATSLSVAVRFYNQFDKSVRFR